MEEEAQNISFSSEEYEVPKKKIGWWDLPHEMRSMIIEKMDDETKLTFLLCSDDCALDMARNYITTVELWSSTLEIVMKEDVNYHTLEFSNDADEICTITYTRYFPGPVIWSIKETGPMLEVMAKYFQRMMNSVTQMEKVIINSPYFPLETTSIQHLRKLEELFITGKPPIDMFAVGFIDYEQLSLVSDKIYLQNKPLTYHHLQKMKATEIELNSEDITSEDVNRYLKLFENGQLHENLRDVRLFFTGGSEIDIEKVMDGLNVFGISSDSASTYFILVNAENTIRIASVHLQCNGLYMVIRAKEYFHQDQFFRQNCALAVDNYLESLPK